MSRRTLLDVAVPLLAVLGFVIVFASTDGRLRDLLLIVLVVLPTWYFVKARKQL